MEFTPMPDLEAVAIDALKDAGICGGRVYSSVPAKPVYPLVVVQRIGGIPVVPERQDSGNTQVSVWGNNKAEARDAAEEARRVLHALRGTANAELEAWISNVQDSLGLFFIPDIQTDRDRYIFSVLIEGHDYPSS